MTAQGVEFESVNYIEHPLSAGELKDLLRRAGLKPHDVLRTKESAYREFVAGKDLSNDALLGIMAAHPELLQRADRSTGRQGSIGQAGRKSGEAGDHVDGSYCREVAQNTSISAMAG